MKLIPIQSVNPLQLPYDFSLRSVVFGYGCNHNHEVVWKCGIGHTESWWHSRISSSGNKSSCEPYEADLVKKFKRVARSCTEHFSRKVVQYTSVLEVTILSPKGVVKIIELEDNGGFISTFVYAESIEAADRMPFVLLAENARACDEMDILLGASEKYRPRRTKVAAA